MQLRTDGVNCGESAGAGLVNLKVEFQTDAALAGHHGPKYMRLSFPHPLLVGSEHVAFRHVTHLVHDYCTRFLKSYDEIV